MSTLETQWLREREREKPNGDRKEKQKEARHIQRQKEGGGSAMEGKEAMGTLLGNEKDGGSTAPSPRLQMIHPSYAPVPLRVYRRSHD